MKFLIRGAEDRDLQGLQDLAKKFHLCSLNPKKENIEWKIKTSKDSFRQSLPKSKRNFLFVLEDLSSSKVVGTSQIFAEHGTEHLPYYYFSLESDCLKLRKETKPATLLGGLLLHPQYRSTKEKLGIQISLIRFLFLAGFPESFQEKLEICLTATLREDNESDFWDGVGRKYLPYSYKKASELYQKDPHQFYSHFKEGLEISLKEIPPLASEVLGQVHEKTQPVYKALNKLGFKKVEKYHILDGGFSMEACRSDLALIQSAKKVFVKACSSSQEQLYLWAQQSSHQLSGGLVRGNLKGEELFAKEVPNQIHLKEPVVSIPLS